MEQPRPILSSNYSSPQLPLNDLSGLPLREPLSDAAGNSQPHALASRGLYHDDKGHHPQVYSQPTVPSQHPQRTLRSTLEFRRQTTRKLRHQRYDRHPIVDSPHYKAYRDRQSREGNSDDAKWPPVLEDAFLDGTVFILLPLSIC
jgi:hypothetical protein